VKYDWMIISINVIPHQTGSSVATDKGNEQYQEHDITTLDELKLWQKRQRKLWKKYHPEELQFEKIEEPVPQPCPVCGGKAEIFVGSNIEFCIRCVECFTSGRITGKIAEAIAAWNRLSYRKE